MILLIDDEIDVLDSMWLSLKMAGFENILKCSNPESVIQLLSDNDFSLCIVDIGMNKINGIELMQVVAEKFPKVKIVCVSGYADSFKKDLKDIGVARILSKPYSSQELVKAINEVLNEDPVLPKSTFNYKIRYKIPKDKSVVIDIISEEMIEIATAKDISLGGAAIFCPRGFCDKSVNGIVDLNITLPHTHSFKAKGIIKHLTEEDDHKIFGVSFTQMEKNGKELLLKFLSTLKNYQN